MSECKNCGADVRHSPCCGRSEAYANDLTTLRQQVAALARECEAARGRLTNLGVAYTTVGPEFPSHPKCKAYAEARAATDRLIPSLTTIAGGST